MKLIKNKIIYITIFSFIMVSTFSIFLTNVDASDNVAAIKTSVYDYSQRIVKTIIMKDSEISDMFKGSYVLGDSLAAGLVAYEIISEEHCVGTIGQSVGRMEKDFDSIKDSKPKNIFMEYGLNDLGILTEHSDLFYKRFKKQIKYIKKELPNVKIYIISIPPVSDRKKDTEPYRSIASFNQALVKLAKDEKVKLIDVSGLVKQLDNPYTGDGIHPNYKFYSLWAKRMILEALL